MSRASEVFFIDANIPMYAAGQPSPYKTACIAVLEASASGQIPAATDTEVIQEIAYRYSHIGQRSTGLQIARDFAAAIPRILAIEPPDVLAMLDALEAHPDITPRDAIHYAVIRRHGIRCIITADRHFSSLPDIQAIDPRDFSPPPKKAHRQKE